MLKIAALSLLLLLGQNPNLPEDFRSQALAVANQALAAADSALSATSSPQPAADSSTPSSQTPPTPITVPFITPNATPMPEAPASKARIEIVSPIAGKGLGRTYKAAQEVSGEENYIVLGAVVYNDAGDATKDAITVITVENAEDKTTTKLEGTGDVFTYYVDGQKRQAPVFEINYEFKVSGTHIFTFSANGYTQSTTVSVQ